LEKITMTFGAPEWLWGLLLVPLLIGLFVQSERRGLKRLQQFVSARLLPQLAGTVNRPRRIIRFGLLLVGLALEISSLAQPRWGYTFVDVKRKGLDLLVAVDTSRSMLSNDVQPNRLDRVKLAIQDLIDELQGDRVGLIAFAGRAFLQAPLTIDYDAVIEAVNDLDTKTIPEGGTNISSAITLATQSFGKSAMGNRALIIFTDGEDLNGEAVKTAKAAADAGVRIFTIGVGTPQGSLIPVTGDNGETSFVKDSAGQVVKSKLDDKRLREVAEATGGFYLHLENGPRTMQQVQTEGLAKMQAAEMDVRLSRRPIERYEWPLSAALIALALSMLIPERKRVRARAYLPAMQAGLSAPTSKPARSVTTGPAKAAGVAVAVLMFMCSSAFGTAPGVNAYQQGKFEDAYKEFQQTLKSHPESRAEDELQFDSGTAAYKLKDYNKAMESFSQALLTRDTNLQGKGHYNLGNTLYQRGEMQKSDDKKLSDWKNALDHYEQTLKLDPQNKEAKDNYEYVKRKIEELKNKKEQQQPSPSPSPPQKDKQKKQDQQQKQQNQQNQDQQQQQKDQQQKDQKDQQQQQQQQQQRQNQNQQDQKDQQQAQNQQSQNQSGSDKDKKEQQQKDQSQAKNEPQKKQQQQPGQSASPSPGGEKKQDDQPSPSPGERQAEESPSPGEGENGSPSPSPGEGEEENASPTPAESPQKKFAGEVKGAAGDNSQKPADKNEQVAAEAEKEKEGQMSERQALALLESMKDEEARVRLDERKVKRHVYNDW
jgi:Ca-activated chloride channel family protein